MAIFAAAMMAIGMIGGAQTARIQSKASMKMAEEQTKQSKAKQEELNSQSELARSIQKINNDRIMRAADKTFAAAATNLSRNRAATQTSNVMTQIAQAAGYDNASKFSACFKARYGATPSQYRAHAKHASKRSSETKTE